MLRHFVLLLVVFCSLFILQFSSAGVFIVVLSTRVHVVLSTRLPRLAISARKRSIIDLCCKIIYVSKFTAPSRSSPCDSSAFLFLSTTVESAFQEVSPKYRLIVIGSPIIYKYNRPN